MWEEGGAVEGYRAQIFHAYTLVFRITLMGHFEGEERHQFSLSCDAVGGPRRSKSVRRRWCSIATNIHAHVLTVARSGREARDAVIEAFRHTTRVVAIGRAE